MAALLLLLSVLFAQLQDSVPNRQPQIVAGANQVALTFGAGNTVYFASSGDSGVSWTSPVVVSSKGMLSLGMRRGPRVAMSGSSIVISAVVGEKGRGADGDLVAWRSVDRGQTWSAGKVVNDVPGSAREGLHAMVSGTGNTIFVTWLDLRAKGTKLYGSVSQDGGATWSPNRLVYESPSGSVCECCHPTAFIDTKGQIFVMFRNSIEGNRDMYVVSSGNGGRTFGPAQKLGSGAWELKACPMDGGSFVVGAGGVSAVWRREGTVYRSAIGGAEEALGPGRQPVAVLTPQGTLTAWTEEKLLKYLRQGETAPRALAGEAAFPSLTVLPNGDVLVAAERGGTVFVEPLP